MFPSVIKAGFVFGGESGNGVLLVNGKPEGFYNITGGSWGLQAGAQDFSYAVFFMTDSSPSRSLLLLADIAWHAGKIILAHYAAGVEARTPKNAMLAVRRRGVRGRPHGL